MIYFQIFTDYFIISLCPFQYTRRRGKWPLNKGPFTRRDKISWPLVASSKWSLKQGKIYRE